MYYIIIRGPAGVGKTTIAKKLTKIIKGHYVSFDKILKDHDLEKIKRGMIGRDNFIEANKIIVPVAKKKIAGGRTVIFDSNFYHKTQITHLIRNLHHKHLVFTLKADLNECIERDKKRKRSIGEDAVKAVYRSVSKFDYGIAINTRNKTADMIVKEILSYLPKD